MKPGLSPFAVACLLAGCYQAWCLRMPDFLGMGAYAFPVATLTGPLAWREIKVGRGTVRGKALVVVGMLASLAVLILKFFLLV